MNNVTIYHNPRCSKSRETLAILQAHNIEPEIILYLDEPPTIKELKNIVKKLGLTVRDIVRKCEPEFKENYLDDETLSDDQLLETLVEYPCLIQRPIVVCDKKAVIGRPPENVLALI